MYLVKDIRYIATSACFRLGLKPTGDAYNYMEQVAIDYLSERAPLDQYVGMKTFEYTLGTHARTTTLPSDCMRISRIGYRSGNSIVTLTVDPNLIMANRIFSCREDDNEAETMANSGYNTAYWTWGPNYTLGGGRNFNYYRIEGNRIEFSHNLRECELVIEYFSNGSDLSAESMIDMAYAEPMRYYLMHEYCLNMGTREQRQKCAFFLAQYEGTLYNANFLVKADRMSELIDAMAQSSEFNLG